MAEPSILIVDNNRLELEQLALQLKEEGYATMSASSLEEMDSAMMEKQDIKLALLDVTGFDESIWERCDKLHEAKIPYIVITPQRSPVVQRESMKHGACGLLVKPLGIKELIEHIHAALGD
jgi:DNA-binding response OmpR family regulator